MLLLIKISLLLKLFATVVGLDFEPNLKALALKQLKYCNPKTVEKGLVRDWTGSEDGFNEDPRQEANTNFECSHLVMTCENRSTEFHLYHCCPSPLTLGTIKTIPNLVWEVSHYWNMQKGPSGGVLVHGRFFQGDEAQPRCNIRAIRYSGSNWDDCGRQMPAELGVFLKRRRSSSKAAWILAGLIGSVTVTILAICWCVPVRGSGE